MKPITQQRLLEAALEVFSNHGFLGATTREIARVAGVNEVTLFRHFESKDLLLIAVVREVVKRQARVLDRIDFESLDLERDIAQFARAYDETLDEYKKFIRAMLGEAERTQDQVKEITMEVVKPLRARLVAYLSEAQNRGIIRPLDPEIAVEVLTGMLFAGVIRRSAFAVSYSRGSYRALCVDIFLRGVRLQSS